MEALLLLLLLAFGTYVCASAAAVGAHTRCAVREHLGCFAEDGREPSRRVLAGWAALGAGGEAMSHAICAALCHERGFGIAGVEYGHQCFCGDELRPGAARVGVEECVAMPCTADATQGCGGPFLLLAFRFSCEGGPVCAGGAGGMQHCAESSAARTAGAPALLQFTIEHPLSGSMLAGHAFSFRARVDAGEVDEATFRARHAHSEVCFELQVLCCACCRCCCCCCCCCC